MGGIAFNSSGAFVSSIDIGISGLNAARIALMVTGHNIANINTPGYSRQIAIQTTAVPAMTTIGALGRGTQIIGIQALRDRFVEVQLALENRELGRLATVNDLLTVVESIFLPTNGNSLSDSVNNLFGSFYDLSANPESMAQREETLALARNLQKKSGDTVSRLTSMISTANAQIEAVAGEINTTLSEIASLNVRIAGGQQTGRVVEDLIDLRNLKMRQLNEMIGVESYETENGSLTVVTGNGVPLVVQNQYAVLSTQANSLDRNKLDVISTFNNSPSNITQSLTGGKLGALLDQRDGFITDRLSAQRMFAAILADTVNIQHRQGTTLDGTAGLDFFVDPFDVYDSSSAADIVSVTIVGDNATYEVNYSYTTTSSETITDISIDDPSLLTKHNYRVTYSGGSYSVLDTDSGLTVATGLAGPTLTFEGLSVTISGVPNDGETFDLSFDGRTGLTGHVYRIEFTNGAGDYDIFDVTAMDSTPILTGTLAGPGFIFFDGLAVEFDAVPATAGDFFTIGYEGLEVDPNLTAETIAASDSPVGDQQPGNNGNALALALLGEEALAGLGNRSFSMYQANEISRVGSAKAETESLLRSQEVFVDSLQRQRDSVSGVSLDEEAVALVEFEQAYQANARFISAVDGMLEFLINMLIS